MIRRRLQFNNMALVLMNIWVCSRVVAMPAVHVRVVMLIGSDMRVQHAGRHQHEAHAVDQTNNDAKSAHRVSVA